MFELPEINKPFPVNPDDFDYRAGFTDRPIAYEMKSDGIRFLLPILQAFPGPVSTSLALFLNYALFNGLTNKTPYYICPSQMKREEVLRILGNHGVAANVLESEGDDLSLLLLIDKWTGISKPLGVITTHMFAYNYITAAIKAAIYGKEIDFDNLHNALDYFSRCDLLDFSYLPDEAAKIEAIIEIAYELRNNPYLKIGEDVSTAIQRTRSLRWVDLQLFDIPDNWSNNILLTIRSYLNFGMPQMSNIHWGNDDYFINPVNHLGIIQPTPDVFSFTEPKLTNAYRSLTRIVRDLARGVVRNSERRSHSVELKVLQTTLYQYFDHVVALPHNWFLKRIHPVGGMIEIVEDLLNHFYETSSDLAVNPIIKDDSQTKPEFWDEVVDMDQMSSAEKRIIASRETIYIYAMRLGIELE